MYDIDGDGASDIVFGLEDEFVVFGSTIFALDLPEPGVPSGFAFGDYDGDGLVDIAVAVTSLGGSTGYVALASSAAGDMLKIADVPYAFDIVTGDFNGDGLADLAAPDGDNGRVAVLLQAAPGRLRAGELHHVDHELARVPGGRRLQRRFTCSTCCFPAQTDRPDRRRPPARSTCCWAMATAPSRLRSKC